ncbi:FAD-NAD(P)-binding-domain-containing protein [Cladorrhinum samala]|uniref:FAD-NAD(P)-binding-domain-containing protein n=1 Tax=Cladorrhinum samala TaxID=585594 RepID=A0AAV9HKF4_9PEZI|nr:FAD-NAD(P)-binding-domain-containing protein [Cladorrhinum samala]
MSSPRLSVVAICGGGACGLAVALHLLRENRSTKCISHIYMYEKRQRIGSGLAYSESSGAAILNMSADTMGLYESEPTHFAGWVASNRQRFQGIRYPPRHVYGDYAAALFDAAEQDAGRQGVDLRVVPRELVRASRNGTETFLLVDDEGGTLEADRLVLALGNFPSCTQPGLADHPRYFDCPWPLRRLDVIPPTAAVCVLGTRLSGIDAALHLEANGHRGPIYLASRTGRLPGVQGLGGAAYQGRYALHLLARDLESRPGPSSAQELSRKFGLFMEDLGVQDWESFFRIKDPAHRLAQDVAAAEHGTARWRALPDAAAPMFERYWNCLSISDRAAFLQDYNSLWYAFVHAMPHDNAVRLQRLIHRGKVKVLTAESDVIEQSGRGFVVTACGERIVADFLIGATGIEQKASRIPSRLAQSLLSSQIMEEHPLGGFSVDQHTLESTSTKGIFAIGSLTAGVHFYTNGIDRNRLHASRIARHITGQIVPRRPGHVAIVLTGDPPSWVPGFKITKVMARMLERHLIPFCYHVTGHACSTRQLESSERHANEARPIFHDAEDVCAFSDEMLGGWVKTNGLLAQCFDSFGEPFHVALKHHYIDIGLLLGDRPTVQGRNSSVQVLKGYLIG